MKKSFKYPRTMSPQEMTEAIMKDAKEAGFKNFKMEVGEHGGEIVGEELVGNDQLDNTITVVLSENV